MLLTKHKESKPVFALVDCNNFYCSCERLFNPSLRNKPVVVLSNNDGCAVARSNESKALGIKMGEPYFKWKHLEKSKGVKVFSSNYVLYGDMSERVMKTLEQFSPEQEIYSIDESFLRLDKVGFIDNLNEYGQKIRYTVGRDTGLPVSVGIAPTKTLSKVANHFVKRDASLNGVLCLDSEETIDSYLKKIKVGDIWGIGQKRAEKLESQGIFTAYQLKGLDDKWIQKNLTICGLRTAWELRGISCIDLEEVHNKKSIVVSRSFGKEVVKFEELLEAVSSFITRAGEKARKQNSKVGYMQIFITSNRFRTNTPYYSNSAGINLDPQTDDTSFLLKHGRELLKLIYNDSFSYKKAGVLLTEFSSRDEVQLDYAVNDAKFLKRQKLMSTIDIFNKKENHGKIRFAQEGMKKTWDIRSEHKSPRYTTSWKEILTVK